MGELSIVTDANFTDDVLSSEKPVLVDFWAEWCGPCRMVTPILEDIASTHSEALRIVKLNVDENPKTAAALAITSLPTLAIFQNGEMVKTIIGAKPKQALLAELQPYL
jgi:thioredoxin 1